MKNTLRAAAATFLLMVQCMGAVADERADYNRRAAETDMSVFRELNRSGTGFLTREEIQGDMRLGPRFNDIDVNRDDVATPQEMQRYLEQTYGVTPAPASIAPAPQARR